MAANSGRARRFGWTAAAAVAAGMCTVVLGSGAAHAADAPGPSRATQAPTSSSPPVSAPAQPLHSDPEALGRSGATTLTISGVGCLSGSGQPASVTVHTSVTSTDVTATSAPDGQWTAPVVITAKPPFDAVTVTASCDATPPFAYPRLTVSYVPFVVGDGFDVHMMNIVGPRAVTPGQLVRVHSTAWQPHQRAYLTLDSSEAPIATLSADGAGIVDAAVRVPLRTAAGRHQLKLGGGRDTVTASMELSIVDSATVQFTVVVPHGDPGPRLAVTGSSALSVTTLGALLLLAGIALLLVARRAVPERPATTVHRR